jgi:tetratricopeptide (TPR) repeat protein
MVAMVWATCAVAVVWTGAQQRPDPAAVERLAAEGERALVEGRYIDAEGAYETLRRITPGAGEIHARLGLIYFQQGKFAQAVEPLREALRLKPGLVKVNALLAMSLSELGRFEEAVPELKRAFAQAFDPVIRRMAGLHLLRAYTGLQRDADAVDVAFRLSRFHPDDPEVLYHSGRVFANFAYLQTMRLSRVAPGSVWLHLAAGEANESQGLHDAAIVEYREVLAAAPGRPGVHLRLGRVLLARARETGGSAAGEAAREFEAELVIDPTNANAAYELAEMARRDGALERARGLFEQAVTHYPTFADALIGLARTLIELGRPADALVRLNAVIADDPDNQIAHYQAARAYGAMRDMPARARALAAFTRARDVAARNRTAVPPAKTDATPQELDGVAPP